MREQMGNERESELIIGRNPVMEALKAGREIDTLYVAKESGLAQSERL